MTHAFRKSVSAAALLLALAIIPTGASGEPTIIAPQEPVPIGGFADVTVKGLSDPASLAWVTVPEIPVRVYAVWGTGEPILSVPTNAAGTWTMVIAYVEAGKPVLQKVVLVIGTGPTPPPKPIDPPVPPGPSGLRVLILEETDARPSLSRDQLLILSSPEIRTYIDSKAKDAFRILDDDLDADDMVGWSETWKDGYAQAKLKSGGTVPYWLITNGTAGTAGPLPANVTDALATLRRYGG